MSSSWRTETGSLVCRWSEVGQPLLSSASVKSLASNSDCIYLPPLIVDFTGRSPFGGASWFQPHSGDCR